MLWFSFDGAVKGWELIMWQAQTPRLAVQPQTAGAEPLGAVRGPQYWGSMDPPPLPGARQDRQHSPAFLSPFWLVVLIAELALVLHYPYLLSLVSPLLSVSSDCWDLRYFHLAAASAKLWSFCRRTEPWLSLGGMRAC